MDSQGFLYRFEQSVQLRSISQARSVYDYSMHSYWACGPVASNPNREGGSVSTRPMASRHAHSSAPSLTHRVTGPTAKEAFASNPNREGGSVSTRSMAPRNDHSSASSLTSGYWCERKLWTSGGDFGSFGNQRYHHQNASNDPKGDGIRPNIVLGSLKESEF